VSTIRMGTRPLLLHRPEEVLLGVPVHVTIQLALQLFTQLQGQPLELGPSRLPLLFLLRFHALGLPTWSRPDKVAALGFGSVPLTGDPRAYPKLGDFAFVVVSLQSSFGGSMKV
jgi:hypothetical protein